MALAPTRFAPARTTAGVGGILAPRGFVELSVASSGVVSDVLVAEGDQVQAGQVLVRLNDTRFKLAVAEANLKLSQAELNLTQVQKPADPADLARLKETLQKVKEQVSNDCPPVYVSSVDYGRILMLRLETAAAAARAAGAHARAEDVSECEPAGPATVFADERFRDGIDRGRAQREVFAR